MKKYVKLLKQAERSRRLYETRDCNLAIWVQRHMGSDIGTYEYSYGGTVDLKPKLKSLAPRIFTEAFDCIVEERRRKQAEL